MMWGGPPVEPQGRCADCDVTWRNADEPCWFCGQPGETRTVLIEAP